MAITLSTLNIVDKSGNTTTVLSDKVKAVNSFEGDVDVEIDVYGQDPQIIKTQNTAATGSVTLNSGSGTITNLTVNSVSIFDTSTAVSGSSLNELAANLVIAVNSFTSVPINYTASAAGAVVTISADKAKADAPNGYTVASTVTGTLAKTDVNLSGGTNQKSLIDAALSSYNINVTLENGATKALNVLRIRSVNQQPGGGSLIYYNEAGNTFQKVEEVLCTQSFSQVKTLIDGLATNPAP